MGRPTAIVVGVGAEQGLGAAVCRRAAREGHHVFVAGRTAAKIEQVVATIRTAGGSAEAVVTDTTVEADVIALFDDLSVHPATARHLSRKLAIHFVADDPPAGLIDDLASVWLRTDGDLARVCAALAEHPLARDAAPAKIRQPVDYIVAGLRALGETGDQAMNWPRGRLRRVWLQPQVQMGQSWLGAPSPAGWPESAADWLTASALAARIDWAMDAPARVRATLPDARDFVDTALDGQADERLRRLVAASETNTEGVGLVLASPAFQRR